MRLAVSMSKERVVGYVFGLFAIILPPILMTVRFYWPRTGVLYEDALLHTFLESISSALAILLGVLLYALQSRLKWSTKFLWASCSLLSMGILMAFHALFNRDDNSLVNMETFYNLFGGFFAALCWFPRDLFASSRQRAVVFMSTAILALVFSVYVVSTPEQLPIMVVDKRFDDLEAWLSGAGGVLFLIGTVRCFKDYLESKRIKDLYLTDFFLLSGVSSLLPANSFFIWGPTWWAWHFIQITGFLSVLALFIYIGACFEKDLYLSEKRFRQLSDELMYSNRDLKQFAAFASHDLKEPVRTVSSYLSLLERRGGNSLNAEGKEFLQFAQDGIHRMRDLIEGFLHFARLDSSPDVYVPVNLQEVFDEATNNLGALIRESGARVARKFLPTVNGDRAQLVDLFQNLIANAIRFRDPKRPVQVYVAASSSRGIWTISFHDNGVGIAKEFQTAIFEPLRRLHGNEMEGCGLGLAICSRIAERHGGSISVESKVGEGSTFKVVFPPLARSTQPEMAPPIESVVPIRRG